MVKTKKFVLLKPSYDFPKPSDFKLEEEELAPLKENEFLAEAVYISVDPYMRAYMPRLPRNRTMTAMQVAKIIESRNSEFPVGTYVTDRFGWRTHTISNGNAVDDSNLPTQIVPDLGDLPASLMLGVLGRPGNSAYFGFLEICQPNPGETVVVSGAAGAVGSHVGQIGKIKGCKVIGIAGSDEKGKWLTEELGFDHFINYKTQDVQQELSSVAPEGIDIYFDNVGGEISTAVIYLMNTFGRVCVCGSISGYNDRQIPKVTTPMSAIVSKQLKVEGILVARWNARWREGINQNLEWIKQGKLKYKETITDGFKNTFHAFTDMLKGKNIGKAIVKV